MLIKVLKTSRTQRELSQATSLLAKEGTTILVNFHKREKNILSTSPLLLDEDCEGLDDGDLFEDFDFCSHKIKPTANATKAEDFGLLEMIDFRRWIRLDDCGIFSPIYIGYVTNE